MADDSPAAVLRQAAQLLHGLAAHATSGPWTAGGIGNYGWTVSGADVETDADSDQGRNNATWIALMSPDKAWSLVAWLEYEAGEAAYWGPMYENANTDNALTFARSIIRSAT